MKSILLLFALISAFSSIAQSQYAKVKIFAADSQLQLLENIGIPTDHGSRKKKHLVGD